MQCTEHLVSIPDSVVLSKQTTYDIVIKLAKYDKLAAILTYKAIFDTDYATAKHCVDFILQHQNP